jgi:hypothetical protein
MRGMKTAQRTKEVAQTMETHRMMEAIKDKTAADLRIRERMLTRLVNLEQAVANLAKKVETLTAREQGHQKSISLMAVRLENLEAAPTKTQP